MRVEIQGDLDAPATGALADDLVEQLLEILGHDGIEQLVGRGRCRSARVTVKVGSS